MTERTPQDFVSDMQKNGRSWLDIISVARVIRGGRWYDDVKCLLQRDGDMPLDEALIIKMRKAELLKKEKPEERSRYITGAKAHKVGPVKQTRNESIGPKD